jgi:hypothetical protein
MYSWTITVFRQMLLPFDKSIKAQYIVSKKPIAVSFSHKPGKNSGVHITSPKILSTHFDYIFNVTHHMLQQIGDGSNKLFILIYNYCLVI